VLKISLRSPTQVVVVVVVVAHLEVTAILF
jgi:hypothetical protein